MAIKMVFFDLEGTLIQNRDRANDGSLWGRIPLELGPEAMAEDERLYAKWNNGGYSNYVAWCDESMESFRKHRLTKKVFRQLLDEATMRDGIKEVVTELHRRGIVTAIISGGFHQQAAKIQLLLGIRHAFAAVQVYWNTDGTVASWNSLPADNQGKVEFVELMRKEFNFEKEECAFVGNGKNDVYIAQHTGISFAVPDAHQKLKDVATHTLEDFRDILKYI